MQRYQLFIDGQWRDPSTGRWFETANPYTGEAWARDPARRRGRRRARRRRRAPRLPRRRLARAEREPARPPRAPLRRSAREACRGTRHDRGARQRQALRRDLQPGPLPLRVVPVLRRPRRQDRGQRAGDGQAGRAELHAPRAARRLRLHHAVELAAAAARLEGRAGARRRQHAGDQAVRVHLGLDARVRAPVARGGPAARRRQRRHRLRRRSRRAAGAPSEGAQGRLHGRRVGRPLGQRRGRGRLQARDARARRQVRQHRLRRRQPRPGRQRRDLRHLRRQRSDLHRGLAPAAAGLDPRRVPRASARDRRAHPARRPDAARDPGRAHHDRAAVPPHPRVHRDREGRGRALRARRRSRDPARRRAACSCSRRSSPT